jgi:hypothetical protein
MSANRESRGSRRYLKAHGNGAGFDPRDEELRPASRTRQAAEVDRQRAQALKFRHLPSAQLSPLEWIAHQLCALGRKGGLQC